jgi:RND family efflux transporter MFP subunit
MRDRAVGAVVKGVRTLLDVGTSIGFSDGQLLERYLLRGDDAAEAAFRALVERHGPMVMRACRGVLHDVHAAEDAFQATFLILARKARSIRRRESVASWLFGVARRVALRADGRRKRRAMHERQGGAMVEAEANAGSPHRSPELIPEVQEEVDRLPERYRAPIVLCYLEGLTQDEAAIRLRLPASTVRVRLMRARSRLRDRLTRRGLAPALLAAISARRAGAAVPAPLVEETIQAAVRVAVGRAAGVSAPVAALVEGVIRAMSLARLKLAAALLAASMLASVVLMTSSAGSAPPRQDPPAATHPAAGRAGPGGDGHEVNVATARRSRWDRTTAQVGRVVSYGSVDVYPRISGYLRKFNVDIGDPVKYGQPLAEIDDPELAIAVEKARAEVERAKHRILKAEASYLVSRAAADVERSRVQAAAAALLEAQANVQPHKRALDYQRDLAGKNVISHKEVDMAADRLASALAASKTAQSQLEVAQAVEAEARARIKAAGADLGEVKNDLQIAQAGLHAAQLADGYTKIVAPFDGVITRRSYHEGAFVRPPDAGKADPIYTVVRSDIMLVVVSVPDREVPYLDVGDPATIRIDALGANRVIQGTITRMAYALDQDRTLRAEIALPDSDGRQRPGLVGAVTIKLDTRENVMMIPKTAIVGLVVDGRAVCFRVVDGRAVRTPIKLGDDDPWRVEVLEGLKDGDAVIDNPDARMPDGQAVTIRRDGDKPAAR